MKDFATIIKMENLLKISLLNRLDNNKGYILNNEGAITSLPLVNLEIKDLDNIISCLEDLRQLKALDLSSNKISDISSLKDLRQLTKLDLSNNKISDISSLKDLRQLTKLDLTNNRINNINVIEYLIKHNKSMSISIFFNGIEAITEKVYLFFTEAASNLESINFLKNIIVRSQRYETAARLRDVERKILGIDKDPVSIKEYKFITNLFWEELYKSNPIKNPPLEIIKQGKEAVIRYFEKIKQEGADYIYEAKLTLVGEGSAGKTSLQKRLLDEKAALPKKDKRTRGINIYDWRFQKEKGKNHIAHIWDFGGQDVYYPVHRFFLTENSVFVLLASTRQTNHNFDYWIPTIYQFGGKSPIILGQTCHDGNKVSWNDLGYYMGNSNFNIIKTQEIPYQEINLPNNNEGLKTIKQTIISQIINLPHYGKGVPKSWIPVRDILAEKSKTIACIPFEQFKEICKKSNRERFANLIDIEDCAKFLHSIGVILWYYDNDDLKNWVVLQPEWAMNAVYKIIDDDEIQERRGIILAKDFTRLWQDACYEGKHTILKKMLEVFKIAFPKKHKKEDYIIPARLLSMPNEKRWQDNEPYLRLQYKYEFMPRGMVNQVSAELSRYIVADDAVWNNAVNFCNENNTAQCQVEEDFYNRKISIRAKGKDARGLIMLVMDALKNITDGYKGVKPEIFVPCTCHKCKTSSRPTTFLYDDLLRWESDEGNASVTCNEGRVSLFIEELLYNLGLPNPLKDKRKKTIRLFLASSSELADERKEFEIFINRENKQLNSKGVFIELNLWEDFIDAMSKTRLQDEYNKAVRECDIFVSLFFTKVGKYTAEEFEAAFGQFKDTGKPFVYTYFKNGEVKMNEINKKDIDSKFEFQEKLKKLGHFQTNFNNIDALKYHFKMQLEKVLPKL